MYTLTLITRQGDRIPLTHKKYERLHEARRSAQKLVENGDYVDYEANESDDEQQVLALHKGFAYCQYQDRDTKGFPVTLYAICDSNGTHLVSMGPDKNIEHFKEVVDDYTSGDELAPEDQDYPKTLPGYAKQHRSGPKMSTGEILFWGTRPNPFTGKTQRVWHVMHPEKGRMATITNKQDLAKRYGGERMQEQVKRKNQMESRKKIKEGLADDARLAESDNEVQMARSELYHIAQDAISLHAYLKTIDPNTDLDSWITSKITQAKTLLSSVQEYVEFQSLESAQVDDYNFASQDELRSYSEEPNFLLDEHEDSSSYVNPLRSRGFKITTTDNNGALTFAVSKNGKTITVTEPREGVYRTNNGKYTSLDAAVDSEFSIDENTAGASAGVVRPLGKKKLTKRYP